MAGVDMKKQMNLLSTIGVLLLVLFGLYFLVGLMMPGAAGQEYFRGGRGRRGWGRRGRRGWRGWGYGGRRRWPNRFWRWLPWYWSYPNYNYWGYPYYWSTWPYGYYGTGGSYYYY